MKKLNQVEDSEEPVKLLAFSFLKLFIRKQIWNEKIRHS